MCLTSVTLSCLAITLAADRVGAVPILYSRKWRLVELIRTVTDTAEILALVVVSFF